MCFDFLLRFEHLTVINADISRLKARYNEKSKICTSVAETEDEKIDEKSPKEKAEKIKMEEFQPKKLVEEELFEETSMRAEELEPEGKHARQRA